MKKNDETHNHANFVKTNAKQTQIYNEKHMRSHVAYA